MIDAPKAWRADRMRAIASVIAVDVWKTTPFMVLLLLAALQTVPVELHAAAQTDGAGAIRRFMVVTLPVIRPALLVAVIALATALVVTLGRVTAPPAAP